MTIETLRRLTPMRIPKFRSEVEELVRRFASDNKLDAHYVCGKRDDGMFVVYFAVEEEEEFKDG